MSQLSRPARALAATPNIFAEMTALAQRHSAINLGQGFPSFGAPSFLHDSLSSILSKDVYVDKKTPQELNFQYTAPRGDPALIETLMKHYSPLYAQDLTAENFAVSCGAQEGIFTSLMTLCNPGDTALIVTPCFPAYFNSAKSLSINLKSMPLSCLLDQEKLRAKIEETDARVLILNTPSSPLGKVFTMPELASIADVVNSTENLTVISDEVYEGVIFDGREHNRFASLPGMHERTISLFSFGKLFSCTGWRLGYAIGGCRETMHALSCITSTINFCTPTPLQRAAGKVFEVAEKEGYFSWLSEMMQEKRDFMCSALDDAGMPPIIPEGGYFVCADVSSHLQQSGCKSASEFCQWLCEEHSAVACLPMEPFFLTKEDEDIGSLQHYIRLAYCRDTVELEEARKRLMFLRNL